MPRSFEEGTKEEIIAHFKAALTEKDAIYGKSLKDMADYHAKKDTKIECLKEEINRLHNLLTRALCFTEYPNGRE